MVTPAPLYHYTCVHSAHLLGISHALKPEFSPFGIAWLTDLDHADRNGLGLTSHILDCDRTQFRFVIEEPVLVYRWVDLRRQYPPAYVATLESTRGALPMHWYVTATEQRVRLS